MPAHKPFTGSVRQYLDAARIPLRLGLATDGGWPLVVSLWYLHQDGLLYCATQSSSLVVAHLRADERCGFEIAADEPPYCGIRGKARAEILPDQGEEILRRLLRRYLGGFDSPMATSLLAKKASEVALRLEPVRWTTWNYTSRMAGSVPATATKPCPPASR